ncbi:thiamine ABC transporter permease [Leminorella grimontii]|uniref:Thiamine transport system permease protein ThiP n=1 Tax=Leminorella grimontii TaxID=82981 RepID=A0AAV5N789_9GAMM|nr:thiamine/thiamine pyrophosphate ABC transporter permease ThiP [Leminorella grimontii]KFC95149.1 membrane component of an ABC superfamily thiamine transporter [Leminorella grimontii ATCC 33999 = DSM 5078]GKX56252.1 thiamine ABC transporter permease [Leminorella grimontii]VFS60880.1 thiamine transporter membrane protein [Leminorella grimontii]
MAKRRQPLIAPWLWPGLLSAGLIVSVALAAFIALWLYAPPGNLRALASDAYLWHVVRFTFWQAFLSAVIAVTPAVFIAGALFRREFIGKTLLLRLCAMTLVLPVLVAVFGLLSVYGQQGWLSQLLRLMGFTPEFSIYGLTGILLAHAFFNLPLATRLLLQALEGVAVEQRMLAAQLGMNARQRFRFVEWPALRRQLLPTLALVFMLCFASFATVLTLGGGPRATTIELAIYQALYYDFDLQRAALLGLIQLFCCIVVVLVSQRLNAAPPVGATYGLRWRDPRDSRLRKAVDAMLIVGTMLFLIPPLLSVIIDGVNAAAPNVLRQSALWQALSTSLRIAAASGLLCLALTVMLLWSSRELKLRYSPWGGRLEACGMMILAMPAIVLATGFFLLLSHSVGLPKSADGLVIFTNALMAIPYALKVLENPMRDLAERYTLLAQSLGMNGYSRLKWIELRALKRPMAQALAFASVLSIGDFGVIALFGNDEFRTLPYYLYQQLGNYRSASAAVTSLLLLLVSFALFTLIERLPGRHDRT